RGVLVVVDYEYALAGAFGRGQFHLRKWGGRSGVVALKVLGAGGERKLHRELAALPGTVALRPDPPAVELDQTLHNREAKPEPTLGAIGRLRRLVERLEDLSEQLLRDPDSLVLNREAGDEPRSLGADAYGRAGRAVSGRVREQVRDHLCKAIGVRVERIPCQGHLYVDVLALAVEQRTGRFEPLLDDARELRSARPEL